MGLPVFREGNSNLPTLLTATRHQMRIHHFLHHMMRGKGTAALMHSRKLRDHGTLNGGLLDVLVDSQPSHHHRRRGVGQAPTKFNPIPVTSSLQVRRPSSSHFQHQMDQPLFTLIANCLRTLGQSILQRRNESLGLFILIHRLKMIL